jgi:hypothetical protein
MTAVNEGVRETIDRCLGAIPLNPPWEGGL